MAIKLQANQYNPHDTYYYGDIVYYKGVVYLYTNTAPSSTFPLTNTGVWYIINSANVFYVNTATGSDSNSGQSAASPMGTIGGVLNILNAFQTATSPFVVIMLVGSTNTFPLNATLPSLRLRGISILFLTPLSSATILNTQSSATSGTLDVSSGGGITLGTNVGVNSTTSTPATNQMFIADTLILSGNNSITLGATPVFTVLKQFSTSGVASTITGTSATKLFTSNPGCVLNTAPTFTGTFNNSVTGAPETVPSNDLTLDFFSASLNLKGEAAYAPLSTPQAETASTPLALGVLTPSTNTNNNYTITSSIPNPGQVAGTAFKLPPSPYITTVQANVNVSLPTGSETATFTVYSNPTAPTSATGGTAGATFTITNGTSANNPICISRKIDLTALQGLYIWLTLSTSGATTANDIFFQCYFEFKLID